MGPFPAVFKGVFGKSRGTREKTHDDHSIRTVFGLGSQPPALPVVFVVARAAGVGGTKAC